MHGTIVPIWHITGDDQKIEDLKLKRINVSFRHARQFIDVASSTTYWIERLFSMTAVDRGQMFHCMCISLDDAQRIDR